MSHPTGRLAAKKAIITGAGLGLGEAIARKFVAEGSRVLIFEIHAENGKRVADALNTARGEKVAVAFEGDVTKGEDWERAVEVCVREFGGLDVVVNNAGVVHRAGPSTQVPLSEYHRIMQTNTLPLYHSATAAQPIFTSQRSGVYINISSISAPRPRPNLVWYAGSKGAVSTITRGLAAEFAKDNVRCNAVLPVVAETGMVANVLGGEDSEDGRAGLRRGDSFGEVCDGGGCWVCGCLAC
ncbi:hypothetical protein Q7P37_006645 [Cladosporium fusiforme]